MPRMSSIDHLPEEIRAKIGQLRQDGYTIDAILLALSNIDPASVPSRSALGRHVIKLDMLGEKLRRSKIMTEALVREVGGAPDSKIAQLNIEMLQTTMLDLFLNAAEGDDENMAEGGKAALAGNPQGIMMLAKAVQSLSIAARHNQEYAKAAEKRAEERAKKEAVAAVERVAATKGARGLSAETVALIKGEIFGVKAA